MAILDFLGKFFAVIGGVWMLALAYKIVGDTWDALFSKRYKKWLAQYTKKGTKELEKINKKILKKKRSESILYTKYRDYTKKVRE